MESTCGFRGVDRTTELLLHDVTQRNAIGPLLPGSAGIQLLVSAIALVGRLRNCKGGLLCASSKGRAGF